MSPALLFVAVEAVYGLDSAEEAVLFAVNAGGEKQRVRGSGPVFGGVAIVPEGERPESIDDHDGIIRILHEADEFVGEAIERGNAATPKIADENSVAKFSEIAGGPDNTPG